MWNIQYGMANKPQPYKDWPNIDVERLWHRSLKADHLQFCHFQIGTNGRESKSQMFTFPLNCDFDKASCDTRFKRYFDILWKVNEKVGRNLANCSVYKPLCWWESNTSVRKERQRLHHRPFSGSKLHQQIFKVSVQFQRKTVCLKCETKKLTENNRK